MSRDEDYRAGLEAVAPASEAYRAGLANDTAIIAHTGGGITPWVPIYRELLAELRATLNAAGRRYEQAAESADIPAADRFDWPAILHDENSAGTDRVPDQM